MKKLLIVLLVLVLLFGGAVAAFRYAPTPKELGVSERFSDAELADAAKLAERYVRGFDGVLRVLRVTYKEKKSDNYLKDEFADGRYDRENTLLFFVDFATGAHTTSLNMWDVYTDYTVTLTRESADAPFTVVGAGY